MTLTEKILLEATRQKYFNIEEVLNSAQIQDIKKRFRVVKQLGQGSNGVAYLTATNQVLKLTIDKKEVVMAQRMQ
jgi:hypothetical protein